PVALEDRGAVLGRQLGGIDHVLDRKRHAVQRARGLGGIRRARRLQRQVLVQRLPRLHLGLARADAGEARLGQLLGRNLALRDQRRRFGGGELVEVGHARLLIFLALYTPPPALDRNPPRMV